MIQEMKGGFPSLGKAQGRFSKDCVNTELESSGCFPRTTKEHQGTILNVRVFISSAVSLERRMSLGRSWEVKLEWTNELLSSSCFKHAIAA